MKLSAKSSVLIWMGFHGGKAVSSRRRCWIQHHGYDRSHSRRRCRGEIELTSTLPCGTPQLRLPGAFSSNGDHLRSSIDKWLNPRQRRAFNSECCLLAIEQDGTNDGVKKPQRGRVIQVTSHHLDMQKIECWTPLFMPLMSSSDERSLPVLSMPNF